jgi:hypothetical protein
MFTQFGAMRGGTTVAVLVLATLLVPGPARGQEPAAEKPFKAEEIDQLVAPIALYPDDLLAQILMASTYPIEIVEASRWRKANPDLKDAELTKQVEAKGWDASVKSLLNFPDVLKMMDEKLEWTQKLGNAFLAQKEDVMKAIQALRKKAEESGNLKSTEQQTVVVEKEVIVIQSSDPDVIYVPTYDPVVVYGGWPYPSYPPYNPWPYPVAHAAVAFTAGAVCGAAWGWAFGGCNWGGNDIDIDIDRNVNRNTNIDRDKYKRQADSRSGGRTQGGKGSWSHDPSHRRGVNYADRGSQQRYGKGPSADAGSRDSYRGRSDAGRGDSASQRPSTADRGGGASRPSGDRGGSSASQRSSGAFDSGGSRSQAQKQSSRGQSSRSSASRSSGSRGGGGRR